MVTMNSKKHVILKVLRKLLLPCYLFFDKRLFIAKKQGNITFCFYCYPFSQLSFVQNAEPLFSSVSFYFVWTKKLPLMCVQGKWVLM